MVREIAIQNMEICPANATSCHLKQYVVLAQRRQRHAGPMQRAGAVDEHGIHRLDHSLPHELAVADVESGAAERCSVVGSDFIGLLGRSIFFVRDPQNALALLIPLTVLTIDGSLRTRCPLPFVPAFRGGDYEPPGSPVRGERTSCDPGRPGPQRKVPVRRLSDRPAYTMLRY